MRLAQQDAGVVDEVARREVVRAVDDDVVVADDIEGVARVERHVVADDIDVRVDAVDGGLGGLGLGPAEVGVRMDDLTMQVRQLDDIRVDDSDRPDPGRGEVEQRGRAEATGTDDEDLGGGESLLPLAAHARDEDVPGVAGDLFPRQRSTRLDQWFERHATTVLVGMVRTTSSSDRRRPAARRARCPS